MQHERKNKLKPSMLSLERVVEMSIYLTYRLRNGKKHGPYGMSGSNYLGPVRVEDDLVFSKVDGSCLGSVVRRAEIPPKEPKPRFTSVETAIRSKFYIVGLTHQNVNDLKFELPEFSDEAIDAVLSDLVRRNILQVVVRGNYRRIG